MIMVPPVPGKYANGREFLGQPNSLLYFILCSPNQHTEYPNRTDLNARSLTRADLIILGKKRCLCTTAFIVSYKVLIKTVKAIKNYYLYLFLKGGYSYEITKRDDSLPQASKTWEFTSRKDITYFESAHRDPNCTDLHATADREEEETSGNYITNRCAT